MKETEKKQTHFLRIAMMVLTTILIVLFFMIMSMVGKIQGTARVINYAGWCAAAHSVWSSWRFPESRRIRCMRRSHPILKACAMEVTS